MPWKNVTAFRTSREDLIHRIGSRYAPASPCDGLGKIEACDGTCVFIGKPCDIAGLRKVQELRPVLAEKVGVALGIFCAGTPSTQGTLDVLSHFDLSPEDIEGIRYRGKGWPGKMSILLKGEEKATHKIPYKESWGFLQRYRPYRCYLCPDGTSEFADISCGNPWYREIEEGEMGYSLVLVRTKRGQEVVRKAMEAGYIHLEKADPSVFEKSQVNLLNKRRAIWGRLLAMKLFGIPTPRFEGSHLFGNWLQLPLKEKVWSILGAAMRIVQRKYYKPAIYYNEKM